VVEATPSVCAGAGTLCAPNGLGFSGGMCTSPCARAGDRVGDLLCAPLPAAGYESDCLFGAEPIEECLPRHSALALLPTCDASRPCRDDYACAALAASASRLIHTASTDVSRGVRTVARRGPRAPRKVWRMDTQSFSELIDIVGPGAEGPRPEMTRARRLWLATIAYLAALALAGAWGLAAGTQGAHVALDNVIKVPVLLVVSAVAALPAALVTFRLTSSQARPSSVVLAFASASFAGTLVMALLAPIVALYQQSSAWAGPRVALASAFVGVLVGVGVFTRVLCKTLPSGGRASAIVSSALLLALHGAALFQLASVVSPVFPTRTRFGAGVDAIGHHAPDADPQ